jgi:hypothetical protein
MKMTFHFSRVADSDITVEGSTVSECTQKAYDQRMIEVTPRKISGDVVE